MKKILLLLLLSVSYFSSAQSTYSIAKALQLQTVNESTSKSDSVLVRGADKIVKFVPRSEFGGGGGAQDLASVLANGFSVDNLPIFINRTDGAFQTGFRLINPLQYTELGDGRFRIVKNDLSQDTNYGNGIISYAFNGDGSSIALQIPAVNIGTKYFPVSINGQYANSDGDITVSASVPTLQQVLDTGGFAEYSNGDNFSFVEFPDTVNNNITLYTESPDAYSQVSIVNAEINLETNFMNNKATLSLQNGNFRITQEELSKKTDIRALSPVADTNIYFPAPPTAGTYFVATKDEINVATLATSSVKTTTFSDGSQFSFFPGADYERGFYAKAVREFGAYGYLSVEPGTAMLGSTTSDGSGESNIRFDQGDLNISVGSSGSGYTNVFVYSGGGGVSGGNSNIYFPINQGGEYTVVCVGRYTVATLPTPTGPSASASYFAIATDATAPTYLGTLTGGGSVVVPVFYNGTSWVAH